ncbi:MAG: hypothetical protein H7Z37_00920 [Pyrinomonadaceae bacterium]|nr:hypothetical protein [Pyrinomonadaceae bacterium]
MTPSKTIAVNGFTKNYWIAFPIILTIYLSFRTKNYYWDGIGFAQIIEDATGFDGSLLHPNHLFYNFAGFIAYKIALIFDDSIRAVDVLQILNCFFAVLCAMVFFEILKTVTRNFALSFVSTMIFAFSATWWKFATDANAYIPSVLFLLISFNLLLPDKKNRPLLVALTHSFAMFFHQLALFFFPVVIVALWFQTASLESKTRVSVIIKYALTAFSLTFGTFCIVFYALTGSVDAKAFFRWLMWYSPENGFTFDFVKNLFLTLRGHLRLFFDGRLTFFQLDFIGVAASIIFVIATTALLIQIGRNTNPLKNFAQNFVNGKFWRQPIIATCAVWCLSYIAFLFFFIPANTFYRLFYVPALIIIIAVSVAKTETPQTSIRKWRLGLFCAAMFCANFLFFIRPFSQVMDDTPLALTLKMRSVWNDKTVVIYDERNSDNQLVRYFNPETRWILLESTRDLKLAATNKQDVWLETTAIEKLNAAPETSEWLKQNQSQESRVELVNKAYNLKFVRIAAK